MDIAAASSASSQSAASQSSAQLTANFDTFLTLLTTQLRNQDPLQPLDTEKFTEQLVQFASVEQSIQTNQHLEALLALQSSSANETALSMVGRIATIESDVASLTDAPARWRYELPHDAAAVAVKVMNANGDIVAVLEGGAASGAHDITWNGAMNNGAKAPQGVYRLVVEAADAEGNVIEPALYSRGRVDGAAFNSGDVPAVEVGGQHYAINLVTRIDSDL